MDEHVVLITYLPLMFGHSTVHMHISGPLGDAQ